jgi:hypothetical protein
MHMVDLSTAEALELLWTHHLGRLGFNADGLPLVLGSPGQALVVCTWIEEILSDCDG